MIWDVHAELEETRMKLALTTLAAAVLGLTALPAAAETGAAKPCFRTSQMGNHTVADDRTLYQKVGLNEVWKITMSGSCLAAAFSTDPLIIKTPGSSGQVCSPIDLDIAISRGGTATSHCIVSEISKLTPEQIAALPPKLKP